MLDMDSATSTTSIFVDKLATETRLQIYEYLLAFESPLTRSEYGSVNTSILCACKKVQNEGIEVFYKLNTICASYDQLCLAVDGTRSAQPGERVMTVQLGFDNNLVQKIDCKQLPAEGQSGDDGNSYTTPTGLVRVIDGLFERKLPRLRSVNLDVKCDCYTASALPAHLKDTETTVKYLAIGSIKIRKASSPITLVIEDKAMMDCWQMVNDAFGIPTSVGHRPGIRPDHEIGQPPVKWFTAMMVMFSIRRAGEWEKQTLAASFLRILSFSGLEHVDFLGLARDWDWSERMIQRLTDVLDEATLNGIELKSFVTNADARD